MGKNILLIGSSGGLGNHFAHGLSAAGHNLALHSFSHEEKAKSLKNELSKHNVNTEIYTADITSEDEVKKMCESMANDFGSIDVLINNAGLSINAMSWKLDISSWNKVLAVNLTGPFLCIKHALPVMRKNNFGRIISISSVVGAIGVAGTSAYSASKAGLEGLCKTVAKETAGQDITVNNISLGYFDAGLLYQIPEDIRAQIKSSIPKKEFGSPDEIVKCIQYLIGESSAYITGQTININGGLY